MWTDLRFAIRGLIKTPGFSIVSIVVLALAVAVNTAIFSLVNAVFLRPLPVKNPNELAFVYVEDSQRDNVSSGVDFATFDALKARSDVFAGGAHVTNDSARLVIDGVERRQSGEMVTGDYFHMLGLSAVLGRTLTPADDEGNAAPAIVISEALWRSDFRADPGIIGRVVSIVSDSQYLGYYRTDASPYTVVGVVASPFAGVVAAWGTPVSYWVSSYKRMNDLRDPEDERTWERTKKGEGRPILRRAPGVTAEQAAAVVSAVGTERLRAEFPEAPTLQLATEASVRVRLPFETGRTRVVPERLAIAGLGLSGLVMLIAIANLIGLFTARGISQRGETTIRLALGATRWRLARQFIAQGLSIAVAAGFIGLLTAVQVMKLFSSTAPSQMSNGASVFRPADFQVPIDWRVWAFGALLPIVAGLLIALSRARQAGQTDVRGSLQAGAQSTVAATRVRLRYAVVVPQIAAALGLLLFAGIFIRALLASELAPPGYDSAQVALVDFDMPALSRAEIAALRQDRQLAEAKLREFASTIGGVTNVVVADNMSSDPLKPKRTWVVAQDERQPNSRGALQWVGVVTTSAGYLKTLGVNLLRGRDLTPADEESSNVALISANLATALWPGEDPIGRRFSRTGPKSSAPPQWIEVVGVVNDVRPPTADTSWNPTFYMPPGKSSSGGTLIARGPGRPDDVTREIVAMLKKAEPRARITRTRTLSSAIAEVRYSQRLATAVLVGTGLVGLLLAAIGLFGVVSYSVAQRRREMGVRRALGADRVDIIALVVREGMTAAAFGTAGGLLLGYWAVRLAHGFAIPMPPASWVAIAAVPLVLAGVVFLACLIPARRAANVDPIVVLRDQ